MSKWPRAAQEMSLCSKNISLYLQLPDLIYLAELPEAKLLSGWYKAFSQVPENSMMQLYDDQSSCCGHQLSVHMDTTDIQQGVPFCPSAMIEIGCRIANNTEAFTLNNMDDICNLHSYTNAFPLQNKHIYFLYKVNIYTHLSIACRSYDHTISVIFH